MELSFLRKYDGKSVRLVLQNNFIFNQVDFKITQENLIEFIDRNGDLVTVEPSAVVMISENEVRE